MKKGVFNLLVLFVIFIFSSSLVYSSDAFGASGSPGTDSQVSDPSSASNIENWPQKAQEFCKKAQDNAIENCKKWGDRFDPGGWWVDRSISASGNYLGKPIDVHIDDWIVGKWDCPPHDLIVDENGETVIQEAIYSENIDYLKSLKKSGFDVPDEEESLEIICGFSCGAWPCAQDYDPHKNCVDTYFRDSDGDGLDDDSGRTKKETEDRLINGRPDEKGGYYYGLKLYCQGEKGFISRLFGLGCKLKDCEKTEIPLASDPDSTTIIRVCCGCSCANYKPDISFNPDNYTALDYDSFDGFFEPKSIDEVKEEQKRDLTSVKNDNIVLTPVGGLKLLKINNAFLVNLIKKITSKNNKFDLIPADLCKKPDASNTFVVADDNIGKNDLDKVWSALVNNKAVSGASSQIKSTIANSQQKINLGNDENLLLTKDNFPILGKTKDTSLSSINIINKGIEGDHVSLEFRNSNDELIILQETKEKEKFIIPLGEVEDNVNANVEFKVIKLNPFEISGDSVTIKVKRDEVLLNDIVIGEKHGDYVGSNLMVQYSLGSPGTGSTASVPNQYSSNGAAVQLDLGEGKNWYYVHSIQSPSGEGSTGNLVLNNIDGGSLSLPWTESGETEFLLWGKVDGQDIYVYDWKSSSPDGIAVGTSTDKVNYRLENLGMSFNVDTDWSTYMKLKFSNGNDINIIVDDNKIELKLSEKGGWSNGVFASGSKSEILLSDSEQVSLSNAEISISSETETSEDSNDITMPSSALISASDVSSHISNADNLILVGENSVKDTLTKSCGELKTNGKAGVTSYDVNTAPGVFVSDNNAPCPLINGCSPQVIIVENPEEVASVVETPEDELVLTCVDNVCKRIPKSEIYSKAYNSIGDCFGKSSGDLCGKRRVACVNKACKVIPVYTIGNPGDDNGCGESSIGASCCNPPNSEDGDCRTVPYANHPKGVEVETDRHWGSLTCDYKVYSWEYCNPYDSELCAYDYNKKIERRKLIGEGTYGAGNFLNCGSAAYEIYTRPWGIVGVKG